MGENSRAPLGEDFLRVPQSFSTSLQLHFAAVFCCLVWRGCWVRHGSCPKQLNLYVPGFSRLLSALLCGTSYESQSHRLLPELHPLRPNKHWVGHSCQSETVSWWRKTVELWENIHLQHISIENLVNNIESRKKWTVFDYWCEKTTKSRFKRN